MKLTKSKLKEIIREEIQKLNEVKIPKNLQHLLQKGYKPTKKFKQRGDYIAKIRGFDSVWIPLHLPNMDFFDEFNKKLGYPSMGINAIIRKIESGKGWVLFKKR